MTRCVYNPSQTPCPVSSVPTWRWPSVPVTAERVRCCPTQRLLFSFSQGITRWPLELSAEVRIQLYLLQLLCGGRENAQSASSGGASTHQRDNNLEGGVWERQGDSLYGENLQVAPHPYTHYPLSQPQGTSVLLSPPVNNGVGCVLPARGVEGSHPTSPPSPPSGGTGTQATKQSSHV